MKAFAKLSLLVLLAAALAACDGPNELPPKSTGVNVMAKYKMPESSLLTPEERAEIEAVRQEFDSTRP